ncbi:uncharacterized protein L969DRAFT_205977 [Mixia osmundae IAM 14324]|uniref:uncharacterized protein n=1 Tax=Mixia osmundae (strain CBS 9802 / IAM 14324 / JCM 22182 / KY 12970) TaxID=764103 RepID=UPI0004A5577C|nr:uncharacterized protein L969DRAFT_205977 [Mixia osmundae IAM 14324]KEI37009.1 hypothetical protein L969DRAFT_205977 [Mixia osmundae IAM 14324]
MPIMLRSLPRSQCSDLTLSVSRYMCAAIVSDEALPALHSRRRAARTSARRSSDRSESPPWPKLDVHSARRMLSLCALASIDSFGRHNERKIAFSLTWDTSASHSEPPKLDSVAPLSSLLVDNNRLCTSRAQ